MPKQFVHCRDFGRQVPVATDGDGPVELVTMPQNVVKVGWSKEQGSVQLAVLHSHNDSLVEHGFPNEVGLEDDPEAGSPEAALLALLSPLYIDLDRAGLNELIQVLRRARDGAFGKDA